MATLIKRYVWSKEQYEYFTRMGEHGMVCVRCGRVDAGLVPEVGVGTVHVICPW